MSQESLVTPEIRSLLGKEIHFTAPEEVGRAALRLFCLAVGDMNPLYLDEDFASSTCWGGIIAPPTFICESWQYFSTEIDEDGAFTERIDPKTEGRLLRGGNEYTFFRPLRPEDRLTATWKLSDVQEKEGKSGRLLILVLEIRYNNQQGELLAINRETFLHQFPTGREG